LHRDVERPLRAGDEVHDDGLEIVFGLQLLGAKVGLDFPSAKVVTTSPWSSLASPLVLSYGSRIALFSPA
jgi:hypothetical protein